MIIDISLLLAARKAEAERKAAQALRTQRLAVVVKTKPHLMGNEWALNQHLWAQEAQDGMA